jgi:hypothetical protein
MSPTCSRCGATADGDPDSLPAGWSLVSDERGVGSLCAECTRTNIRAIEGKLPEEWWE